MVGTKRLFIAIVIYALVIVAVVGLRPAAMFEPSGKPKPWGLNAHEGESVLSIYVSLPVLALISYYLAALIDFQTSAGRAGRDVKSFLP